MGCEYIDAVVADYKNMHEDFEGVCEIIARIHKNYSKEDIDCAIELIFTDLEDSVEAVHKESMERVTKIVTEESFDLDRIKETFYTSMFLSKPLWECLEHKLKA